MKVFALLLLLPLSVTAHVLPKTELGCVDLDSSECISLPKGTHYIVLDSMDDTSMIELQDKPYVGLDLYIDSGEIRSGL